MAKEPSQSKSKIEQQTWLNLGLIGILLVMTAVSAYLWLPRIMETDEPTTANIADDTSVTQNSSGVKTDAEVVSINRPASALMEQLLAEARHIEGSVDAPVTLIEFSDFK
ncbi:MAG: hypothetical protein AAF629_24870 [Chloroflexota bacterium]